MSVLICQETVFKNDPDVRADTTHLHSVRILKNDKGLIFFINL